MVVLLIDLFPENEKTLTVCGPNLTPPAPAPNTSRLRTRSLGSGFDAWGEVDTGLASRRRLSDGHRRLYAAPQRR